MESQNIYFSHRFFLSVLCFIFSLNFFAQNFDSAKLIDYANTVPLDVKNSTQKLSNYLVKPYSTDLEKFASIYYWVAKNIRYDDEMAKNPRLYLEMKEVIDEVMKSKSGVCQHYAELFAELSQLAGLKVFVIDGYTLEKGKVSSMSHAWNLVKIGSEWYFIDATWANAIIISRGKRVFPTEYFMVKPEDFIKTHIAFDPIWQILTSPLKYNEFDASIFVINEGNFNYEDSIANYQSMNSIDQQKATIRRMLDNGTFNRIIKKEFDIKEKNLKTTIQNQEIQKYNESIKLYNNGLGFFNQYIKLRNNKFKDKKFGKTALLNLLDSASVNLKKAETNFAAIKIDDSGIKYQIKTNTANIKKSSGIISKEIEFVNQHFK